MMSENLFPIRPIPTLLLFSSFGLWSGTAFVLSLQIRLDGLFFTVCFILLFLSILFLGICVYRAKSSNKRYILVLLLGVCTGLFCGFATSSDAYSTQDDIGTTKPYGSFLFEIIEDEQENEYGSSCVAKTKLSDGQEIRVRLNFKTESDKLFFGHCIVANTSIELPKETTFPYLWSKGVIATAHINTFERHERTDLFGFFITLRDEALLRIGEASDSSTALLRAILLGERSGLDDEGFYQDIRVVGLAHLIAVSGAHLVIVSASLQILLSIIRVPRKGIVVIQVMFLVFYLILTGIPVSAMRAACMSLISLLSFYPGKRSSALNALGLCVMIMVVLNPWSAISVSFLLSTLSTLGIIVLVSLIAHWLQYFLPTIPDSVQESISLTLAASILISPLVVALFSQYSLVSPIMNVVATPCFTVLCIGGLIILFASLLFPSLGDLALGFLHEGAEAFCILIKFVASLPYGAIPAYCDFFLALCLSFSLLIFIWSVWPKPQGSKLAFLGIGSSVIISFFLFIAPYTYSDEVIMLNVGQGDAFLVRSRGSTVLIDTGNNDSALLRGLGRYGVHRLDAIIISHADDDHYGSLSSLRSLVQVDYVCVAEEVLVCECSSCARLVIDAYNLGGERNLETLSVGKTIRVGVFTLEVIWPDQFTEKGGNADSLTLLLTKDLDGTQSQTMLFCGDAEAKEITKMVERKRVSTVDVYKVGHHGSKNALDDELAGILRPRLALISVGKDNRYGHPAEKTISSLENVGTKILRTDVEGDVMCKFEHGRLDVNILG